MGFKSHVGLCPWQVARILEVSEEMRRLMGVNSGLELITLPYGHQLRLDLIERLSVPVTHFQGSWPEDQSIATLYSVSSEGWPAGCLNSCVLRAR